MIDHRFLTIFAWELEPLKLEARDPDPLWRGRARVPVSRPWWMCLRTTTRLALLLLFAPLFATVSVSSGFCAQTADRGGVGSAAHGMPSKSRKGGGAACGQLGQEAASSSGKRRKGGGSASAPGVSQKDLPSPSVVGVAHADAGNNGQLLTVPGVLSEAECASWVAWAESLGMVSTRPAGGRPGYGDAYRDNFRAQVFPVFTARSLAKTFPT